MHTETFTPTHPEKACRVNLGETEHPDIPSDAEEMDENNFQLFEDTRIRTAWNEESQEWYFSIVDVLGVLTDCQNPKKYWSVLKTHLKSEGNQGAANCCQLKMTAADGKRYNTDVANSEQLLRLVHAIYF